MVACLSRRDDHNCTIPSQLIGSIPGFRVSTDRVLSTERARRRSVAMGLFSTEPVDDDDPSSSSAHRYRAGDGPLFSSSKCPPGPGLESSCELPFGFLWTPLSPQDIDGPQPVAKIPAPTDEATEDGESSLPPVLCLTCLSYLNLYSSFNATTGIWKCVFCGADNVAPPQSLQDGNGSLSSAVNSNALEFRQKISVRVPVEPKSDAETDHRSTSRPSGDVVRQQVVTEDDSCSIVVVLDKHLPRDQVQSVGSALQSILSQIVQEQQQGQSSSKTTTTLRLGLIVYDKSVAVYQLGIPGMMVSADVFPTHESLTEEHINTRHYTVNLSLDHNKKVDLECLWRCLSAVYGVTNSDAATGSTETEDAENLGGNQLSRMEMLKRRKEARIRQRQGQPEAAAPQVAKSPWMEARETREASSTPIRNVGEAIQCAIDLATTDRVKPSRTARILLFTDGCPNYGDGSVVESPPDDDVTPQRKKKSKPDVLDPVKLSGAIEYFRIVGSAASELGVAVDVLCTGALELALPAYQALAEPSSGYVLSHMTFTTEHLQHNLEYILKQTYVSGLYFDLPQGGIVLPPMDSNWIDGCIVDFRVPL